MTDSGAGIPPDQVERIFDMFARITHGDGGEAGLGIGLALARRLAEMHGGTLTASSDGEGKGAAFVLRLPASDGRCLRRAPGAGGRRRASGAALNVLVIEDNEDVAETLTMLLEELGHRVSLARTGRNGVALVQQKEPDVVLCDIGLPGMDGLEVCRQIRALPIKTRPIMVAVTGWGQDADRRKRAKRASTITWSSRSASAASINCSPTSTSARPTTKSAPSRPPEIGRRSLYRAQSSRVRLRGWGVAPRSPSANPVLA